MDIQLTIRRLLSGIYIIAAIVCSSIFAFSKELSEKGRESKYLITSRGFKVGELRTFMDPLLRDGRSLIRFKSINNISAGFLFFSHQSSIREEALIGERGTEEYHLTGNDNGRSLDVKARFSEHQVVIDTNRDGDQKSIVIPRKKFDFTTMDCPEMVTLSRVGDRGEVRLLDLENARIVLRKYVWVRTEQVKVGDRNILCRVIDFEDADNNCRRWITRDDRGVIIARQDGKGKSGTYQLKMTGLTESPAVLQ